MSELDTLETDVSLLEQQTRGDVDKLLAAGRELEARLKRVRDMVSQAQGVGAALPDLAARIASLSVPQMPIDALTRPALVLREQAVKARHDAVKAVKAAMGQQQAALRTVSKQVAEHEAAAERSLGTAKAVAQKVAAAAKQLETEPPPPDPRATPQALGRIRPRRENPRVRMQVKIDFSSDNNFFSGFSTNLSDGGVFIATVKVVPIGTPMDVYFRLPSGIGVEATGVVRWIREVDDRQPDVLPGLGVQFLNLTDEARDAINQFVKSREPMFYPD